MLSGCASLTPADREPLQNSETAIEQSSPKSASTTTDLDTANQIAVTAVATDTAANTSADAITNTLLAMPKSDSDLWVTMRSQMTLDHHVNEDRVQQEIRWFQRHPEYWQRLAPRMQRYLPYIFSQVAARDMPTELVLLPVIESALDPYAFSPYGASGLWQFMRPTAKQYGLMMTSHYDGRRDVIAATTAALDFLQDLYRRFDDWNLALAAYNAGGGTVAKAIRQGSSRDFFSLRLPRETRAYVPRILAMAAIVRDPQLYAVELPEVSETDPLMVLTLPGAFDVAVVAEVLDISPSLIYQFNPALQRAQWSQTTPLRLILPIADGEDSAAVSANRRLKEVPENQRIAWREVNVRRGDTISEIAARHGLSSQSLRSLNMLSSDLLQIGQTLRVPASTQRKTSSQSGTRAYTVRRGDSLWRIAQHVDTSVSALVKLNKIGPRDVLRVGQILQIPGTANLPTEAAKAPSQVRKIKYRVRRGDSLSRIAQRFSLRISDIAAWNNLPTERYLQPGQGLTLYVDVVGG